MTLILSNEEIEGLLNMGACLEVLEEAYQELAAGRAVNQLRIDTQIAVEAPIGDDREYEFKTMVGMIKKWDICALRLSSSIMHWPVIQGKMRVDKIPAAPGGRWVGLVELFSLKTGEPLAIFPDGYVQKMRVGGSYALATKYLARKDARVLGLYGSGWQAQAQLDAHLLVRGFEEVRVFSPNREHREVFCSEMGRKHRVKIVPVDNPVEVMRGSDVVIAATNSVDPVVLGEWMESGMHVGSVKGEVDQAVADKADVIVVHSHLQFETHVAGEGQYGKIRSVAEAGPSLFDREKMPLLEDIIAGKTPGRTSDRQVTYFDGTPGLGIQFAAVGAKLYELARAAGVGREIPTDWLTQSVHT